MTRRHTFDTVATHLGAQAAASLPAPPSIGWGVGGGKKRREPRKPLQRQPEPVRQERWRG
jgi:hypothetical protein